MTTATVRLVPPHAADCPLCLPTAGKNPKGVTRFEVPPICPRCLYHHWPETQPCKTPPSFTNADCPRCWRNEDGVLVTRRRELEDIPESFRWEHKRYAPFCRECLLEEGYVRVEHHVGLPNGGVIDAHWWAKKRPLPVVVDDITTDELFRMAGR